MRVLIINDQVKSEVDRVVKYARANPIPLIQIVWAKAKDECSIDNLVKHEHSCVIPIDYQCCYSVEIQPVFKVAHLSVSVPAPGKTPHVEAFMEIAKLFGFTASNPKDFLQLWLESLPGDVCVVNVLQELEMSWRKS